MVIKKLIRITAYRASAQIINIFLTLNVVEIKLWLDLDFFKLVELAFWEDQPTALVV